MNLIAIFLEENNIPYIASFDSDFDKVEGLKRIKDREDFGGKQEIICDIIYFWR